MSLNLLKKERPERADLKVIGVDPGLSITGYGILHEKEGELIAIDYGEIKLPSSMDIGKKLCIIQNSLQELIIRYSAEVMAIETQFVCINVASALKLGMVRGICLSLASALGIKVYEYAPSTIKKAATGRGLASKKQMQTMIARRLFLDKPPPEDATDALAMALCHLSKRQNSQIFASLNSTPLSL